MYPIIRSLKRTLKVRWHFLGFSDVTSLHMALQQRCGLVTYHGPTANRLIQSEHNDFTWQSLPAALHMGECLRIQNPPQEPILSLRPGIACGELIGGNLSLVTASLATPWEIDTTGRVLFLEDGKIAEEAAPEEFFTAPKTERAKKFLKTFEFDEVKPHRD